MSHFTVLVASKPGQSVEEQLAPFDENLPDVESPKWDWWTIGGRWSGQLIAKDGRNVDQARKGDLDLDGMYREGRTRAAERLRAYQEAVEATGPIPSRKWLDLEYTSEEFKQARKAFWGHPTVKATIGWDSDAHLGFDDVEWIERSPQGWVEGQATSSVVCFAMLTHDGRWLEQGEMGWFGVSDATFESKTGYLEVARAYLDSLDDDTVLTLTDCHI